MASSSLSSSEITDWFSQFRRNIYMQKQKVAKLLCLLFGLCCFLTKQSGWCDADVQSNQNWFRHLQYFSHYHSLFANGNKIWQELRVKLCQNKLILIMSDNFDRKVCNELGWIAISCQLLNLSTELDNTNLGQPVTKQCLNLFSLWCKKVALGIKDFWSQIFINFTATPLYEDFLGYNMSQFTLLCYPHLHKWTIVSCTH